MHKKLTRQDLKDLQRLFWLSNADLIFISNYVERQQMDRDAALIEILPLKQWSKRMKYQQKKTEDPAQA